MYSLCEQGGHSDRVRKGNGSLVLKWSALRSGKGENPGCQERGMTDNNLEGKGVDLDWDEVLDVNGEEGVSGSRQ